jgi:glycosyltransferase involved in cell wall biosynthesis
MSPINFDSSPEISIILCTYNRASYLNRCINSVISQSFQNWEFLIVDDGSDDNTFEIANLYLSSFGIAFSVHESQSRS